MLGPNPLQGMLFPEIEATPTIRGRGVRRDSGRTGTEFSDASLTTALKATTLDRVHAAMLLQAGRVYEALRALLKAEQERGPDLNAWRTPYRRSTRRVARKSDCSTRCY